MNEYGLNADISCPYCGVKNDCEHVLLLVNLTLRQSAGGIICEVFDEVWEYLKDKIVEGDDFDEKLIFHDLLDQISCNSDCESNYVIEGGPGQTYDYNKYYSKNSPSLADISNIKDALYSAVANEDLNVLSPYKQAHLIWKNVLEGTGDFKSLTSSVLEIIVKTFNLSSLPIKLQTELIVRLVDTSTEAPEIVQQISANLAHDIYTQLVNSYSDKLSSVQSYLNKYISFAKEKVTWRRLGYAGVQQRIPDAAIQGAALLHQLLAKEN